MDERVQLIAALASSALSMSDACRIFGVSRKTGYKWLERYKADGPAGLENRSRAPKRTPWALKESMQELLVDIRRRHPTWGPRKILDLLQLRQPKLDLPAASTVGDLFQRQGLVEKKRRRRKLENKGQPFAHIQAANDSWCADFKGHFRVSDGRRCDPLTVTDAFSRFLLCCQGMDQPTTEYVWPAFERLFNEYGLPSAIRTDNGPPFASRALGGLSRLSVRWVKLGIRLERIKPGHPEQNGRHERMHRTLKAETARPPAETLRHQQRRFDRFRDEYNEERPHEALDGRPPVTLYAVSPRAYPAKLPDIEYPGHFERRMVRTDGTIQWRGEHHFISESLVGEPVGLEEIADAQWLMHFGPMAIAILNERNRIPNIIPTPIP